MRYRFSRSSLRALAVGLVGVLFIGTLVVPANAQVAVSAACGLPSSLATGAAGAAGGGTSEIRISCGAEASGLLDTSRVAADDVVMSIDIEGLDPKSVDAELDKIRQAQANGDSLTDIFMSRIEQHKLGVADFTPDGVEVDGTIERTTGGLALIIPASEIGTQSNWWQKAIAAAAGIIAGIAGSVICLVFFAPGAPLAVPVCAAVGGFVTGFVGDLLNSAFDKREFDAAAWGEALAVGIIGAIGVGAVAYALTWAEGAANLMMLRIAASLRSLGVSAARWLTQVGRTAIAYGANQMEAVGKILAPLMHRLAGRSIAAVTTSLRVMPLGDSITAGIGTADMSSYRAKLWNDLATAGHTVDFVGTQQSGQLPDIDNEGHSGALISEIADRAKTAVPMYQPNVVMLHAGTNDMDRNVAPDSAPARLGALIDQILADAPGVTVLVSTLVPTTNPTAQARIDTFNQQVFELVGQRRRAGKKVDVVDMRAVTTADLADGLHPNGSGYAKMAEGFYRGVYRTILSKWITAPGGDSGQCVDTPGRWFDRGQIASGMASSLLDVMFADIDGDRRDDYLVVNHKTGVVKAWLNRGGDRPGVAGWVERGQIASGGLHGATDRIEFADVDGDGRDDYLVVDVEGAVKAWLNRGGDRPGVAGWVERGQIASGGDIGGNGWPIFADVDGDGLDDYLKLNNESGEVYAWLNRGGDRPGVAGWVERGKIAAGGLHGVKDVVRFAQVNCDPRVDYLVQKPDGAVNAWLNIGGDRPGVAGWVERGQIASGIGGIGADTYADIDGDGRDDYLIFGTGGSVRALLNRGGDPA